MLLENLVYFQKKIVAVLLDCFLFVWKSLSPFIFGARCRFYPSCSQYAVDSIKKRGVFVGTFLALKRLSKCHPFYRG